MQDQFYKLIPLSPNTIVFPFKNISINKINIPQKTKIPQINQNKYHYLVKIIKIKL